MGLLGGTDVSVVDFDRKGPDGRYPLVEGTLPEGTVIQYGGERFAVLGSPPSDFNAARPYKGPEGNVKILKAANASYDPRKGRFDPLHREICTDDDLADKLGRIAGL